MATFEVKKIRVTWSKVQMKDIHPKPTVLTTAEKNTWMLELTATDEFWLGVEYDYTDYESNAQKKKTIITAPLKVGGNKQTEAQLEAVVDAQVSHFENHLQEQEFKRVALTMIEKSEEYIT